MTLSVDGTNAATYQWSNNANSAVTSSVTVTPSPPSEIYNVTVTNNQGCTAVPNILIVVTPRPTIKAILRNSVLAIQVIGLR